MTIAKRLIILLAVPLVALVGLGLFIRSQLAEIESRSRFVSESQIPSLAVLGNLSRSFAELRVNVRSYLLATNEAGRTEARSAFAAGEAEVNRLLGQYGDSLLSSDRDRRLLNDYRDSSRGWIITAKQAMTLAAEELEPSVRPSSMRKQSILCKSTQTICPRPCSVKRTS